MSESQKGPLDRRQQSPADPTEQFLSQFYVDDKDSWMTTNVAGPIEEQKALKAGNKGPNLLEDFALRQKITHFDHERVSPHRIFMTSLFFLNPLMRF